MGAQAQTSEMARIRLTKPFNARSDWRLVVTQGPAAVDYGDNPAPGALHLCFEKGPDDACLADPAGMPGTPGDWDPHYLSVAEPVYPRGAAAPPLLLIVTASMHSGDGDQLVVTQLLKYDRARDTFERVYAHSTGRNNNEQDRFIAAGPLRGDIVSVAPTEGAPYGYWVEVSSLTRAYGYKSVLKYRSATRYGDGNPLPVIDSEMPNMEQRLGLWRPGSPLPSPAVGCPKPRLVKSELWCN